MASIVFKLFEELKLSEYMILDMNQMMQLSSIDEMHGYLNKVLKVIYDYKNNKKLSQEAIHETEKECGYWNF